MKQNWNKNHFLSLDSINSEGDPNMRLLRLYRHFNDDAYRQELLVKNFALICSRAKRFYELGRLNDLSIYKDFIQEGSIGFIVGLDKFKREKSKRIKLSTYCVFWIDKYIGQYIIEHGMLVRYTTKIYRAVSKFRKSKEAISEFAGMEVPFDVAIGGQRAIRLGVVDMMRDRAFIDVENVEVTDMEYSENDANEIIAKCGYLTDEEKVFATFVANKNSENRLVLSDKRKLKAVTEKITLWNNRKNRNSMKMTDVVNNFNKLVSLRVNISDEIIESLAEDVYHLEKDRTHKIDAEKAAEMRGIIRGMQIMRDAIQSSKTKK